MMYLLYNPLSGSVGDCKAAAEAFFVLSNKECKIIDVTEIQSCNDFMKNTEDEICIFGGDGTLNRFVNEINTSELRNKIYYFPCGSGNDFARDVEKEGCIEPFLINDYVKELPTVTVKGEKRKFINGVGFGIDGFCCQTGDELKTKGKRVNYTKIAIMGLLCGFAPRHAHVTADGEEMDFERAWIAPTMHGRYYGGGMMPTPSQDRGAKDKELSLMVFHGSGRIKTLVIFPSIFKGEHIKYDKNITVITGKTVNVAFDKPTALQIDGETVLDVSEYSASI